MKLRLPHPFVLLLGGVLVAKVDYVRWLKFAVPGALLVSLVGFAGIIMAQ